MSNWERHHVTIQRDGRVLRTAHPQLTMGFLLYGPLSARAVCWCGWQSDREYRMRRSAVELLLPHLGECVIEPHPDISETVER